MEDWANCENCKSFKLTDGIQTCVKFDWIGLPHGPRVNANNKCCSAYELKRNTVNTPNFKDMKYAVLYYYHSEEPNTLFEDIDL